MELDPIVKQALVDIDFIERYQRLSDEYSAEKVPSEESLVYGTYDDLENILEVAFEMYEDFKNAMWRLTDTGLV